MHTVVVIGSTNPVKMQAARDGFAAMFPAQAFTFESIDAASGVSHQPFGDEETRRGAMQRARHARQQMPDAAYAVGIEGGVLPLPDSDELLAFAWVVILGPGRVGQAKSGAFVLPQEITRLIRAEGLELGEADDRVFGKQDSKRRNGSIGLLTGDALTRTGFYAPAVLMALIPFKNPQLTFGDGGL